MQKETYLQNCLRDGKIRRWSDSSQTLKVYIAPFRFYTQANEDAKYRGLVMKALDEWQKISGGKISFEIVTSLMNSQINIDWQRVERQALGYCYFSFDKIGRLFSAEVQIGISDGIIHQQYMAENEVYHTILHEIGHALGLGHSPFEDGIMFTPHKYGVITISANDILTFQWLYRFAPGADPAQIASQYGIVSPDLDLVVAELRKKNHKSEFEKVKNSIKTVKKDLLKEQQNIADLKKYNIALQNISISEDTRKFFIDQQRKNK
ncbi:matrixin family metalloprotease [bacterium]|nr:matrixin family metalloprotease [bacterium]